jgi:hypothetical protein
MTAADPRKRAAWIATLETETAFFELFSAACEETGFGALGYAAGAHAKALRARAVLAAEPPTATPKRKPPAQKRARP